jgi:hypothetical protein
MHCQELDFPVLHRKADFPDVYAGISNRDLISVYRAGPTRLGGILAGLSDEELTARPRDGKWSAQEIAMHIADAEIMGAARLRQTLAEPGASFAIYDQEAWASTLDYRNRDRKALESAATCWRVRPRRIGKNGGAMPIGDRSPSGSCSSSMPITASGTSNRFWNSADCSGGRWRYRSCCESVYTRRR